jgi:hypothetical protein
MRETVGLVRILEYLQKDTSDSRDSGERSGDFLIPDHYCAQRQILGRFASL